MLLLSVQESFRRGYDIVNFAPYRTRRFVIVAGETVAKIVASQATDVNLTLHQSYQHNGKSPPLIYFLAFDVSPVLPTQKQSTSFDWFAGDDFFQSVRKLAARFVVNETDNNHN